MEQACSSGPQGLVVTDIVMPRMNGLVSAEAIRARGWNFPLIACNAAVIPEQQAACLMAGCNAFVAKSIRREQLLKTCARWRSVAPESVYR